MHESIAERYIESLNKGDIETLCSLFTDDAQIYGLKGWASVAKTRTYWAMLMQAFRFRLNVQEVIINGDSIAIRMIETGVFTDTIYGQAPTGKSYEIFAVDWLTIRDGKIAVRWGIRDLSSAYRQIDLAWPY